GWGAGGCRRGMRGPRWRGKTVTAAEPAAGATPNHFSCMRAIVPSSFMHSTATSSALRSSPESLRSGAAQTRPVEYRYDNSSWGLFLTAHAMTVLPATLASARPTRTACTASVCVPNDSTFQRILPSRSRAQESYADPLLTEMVLPLRSSSCATFGDPFLIRN